MTNAKINYTVFTYIIKISLCLYVYLRCIKSHLPLTMLPPNLLDTCKVIFVARNPKDVCVSYYFHEKLIPFQGFTEEFPDYVKMFQEGKAAYGDYWYHLKVKAWKNVTQCIFFSRKTHFIFSISGVIVIIQTPSSSGMKT